LPGQARQWWQRNESPTPWRDQIGASFLGDFIRRRILMLTMVAATLWWSEPILAQPNAQLGLLCTSEGTPADKQIDACNSPFSAARSRHIGTPELEVQRMLTRVRAEVVGNRCHGRIRRCSARFIRRQSEAASHLFTSEAKQSRTGEAKKSGLLRHLRSSQWRKTYFPHTSFATSTASLSLAHCSSSVRTLPSSVEANPHCGDRASWSSGAYFEASASRRLMSSFFSS
jgi:hypothetical protein